MKIRTFLSAILASCGVLLAAEELTPNIRLVPGGIEVIDRENASIPSFDTQRRLTKQDQELYISFMELIGAQARKQTLECTGLTQSGEISIGRDKQQFQYSSKAEKIGPDCVKFSFSVKRDGKIDLKEKPFIAISFRSALLDTPVELEEVNEAGKFWYGKLIYPREKEGGWLWSTQPGNRVRRATFSMNHGTLTVTGVSEPAMACKYGTNTGNLRLYLADSAFSEVSAELTISYQPYQADTLNLRSAANMGFRDDTPDDKQGGWTDQGPENDLRMMKPGKCVFVNVPFDVIDPAANNGKSVIALGCPERAFLPRQAIVPIDGKKYKWLYFLHADAWPKKKEVGTIQVNYMDGTDETISVVDGRDVANWWGPKSVVNGAVAWQGQNRYEFIGLFVSRFPVKNKPIKSLALKSSENSVWLVLAISGVQMDFLPFPSPDVETVEVPVTFDSRDWLEYALTVPKKRPVKNSVLDLSHLLDRPAGKYGFVKSEGENFVFEKRPGVPIRFNGTNLCFDVSTRFTHEQSDALAEQVAALGLNAVRLHHFDRDLVDSEKTDGSVNPELLDNLHYLVHAMKERGIYVTIDLYTVRTTGFPEKFSGMFDAKTRMVFSRELRDNLMNFARTMLTPVNPYTGLALKDDPALITVGLINENPILTGHKEYDYPNSNPVQNEAIKKVVEEWCRKNGIKMPKIPDQELYIRVMNQHHIDIYREMTEALRKMGVRQMTSDMSCMDRSINAIPRKEYDYVDNHYYFSHPRSLGAEWAFPSSYSNDSMTGVLFDGMTRCMATRIKDKPFTVTEFNFCAPNSSRGEGGLAMGAVSAFQNVGGIYSFDYNGYGHETGWNFINQTGGHLGWFGVSVDPIRLLSSRIIALLYLRGDVQTAPEDGLKTLTVTPDDYKLPEVQNYKYPRSEKLANVPEKFHNLALYTKVAMDAADKVPAGSYSLPEMLSEQPLKLTVKGKGVYQPEKGKIVSSTGEISVDASSQTIKVITPKSEGFTITGKTAKGDKLSVSSNTGACLVFAGALDDKTLEKTSRAVILHLTDIQAKDRKLTKLGDRYIAYNWGAMAPYLLRKSKVEIALKNTGEGSLSINALDVNGAFLASVPFQEENGTVTFTADSGLYGGTMAYEFIRK